MLSLTIVEKLGLYELRLLHQPNFPLFRCTCIWFSVLLKYKNTKSQEIVSKFTVV